MDTLDFQPTIQTKAIVVKSAVNRDTDTVVMIAEIGPNESGPPMHLHPKQHETYQVLEGEAVHGIWSMARFLLYFRSTSSYPTWLGIFWSLAQLLGFVLL